MVGRAACRSFALCLAAAAFALLAVVPNSLCALSGDSSTYHFEAGVGLTGAVGAQSSTYSLDLFASDAPAGYFDPPTYDTCIGPLCLEGAVAGGGGASVVVSSPINATYSSSTPPDLTFTVSGPASSYSVSYNLDGADIAAGTVADGVPTVIDLGILIAGPHSLNVTAVNASQSVSVTSSTVFFNVISAACIPDADPATAPAQCALNMNVSSPTPWSVHDIDSNVSLEWLVYRAGTNSIMDDACVNVTFENMSLATLQSSVGTATFRAGVEGTPKLTVTAYRNGCAPSTKEIYLYVQRQGASIAGFPELPIWLAPLLALLALGLLGRKRFKAARPS